MHGWFPSIPSQHDIICLARNPRQWNYMSQNKPQSHTTMTVISTWKTKNIASFRNYIRKEVQFLQSMSPSYHFNLNNWKSYDFLIVTFQCYLEPTIECEIRDKVAVSWQCTSLKVYFMELWQKNVCCCLIVHFPQVYCQLRSGKTWVLSNILNQGKMNTVIGSAAAPTLVWIQSGI